MIASGSRGLRGVTRATFPETTVVVDQGYRAPDDGTNGESKDLDNLNRQIEPQFGVDVLPPRPEPDAGCVVLGQCLLAVNDVESSN